MKKKMMILFLIMSLLFLSACGNKDQDLKVTRVDVDQNPVELEITDDQETDVENGSDTRIIRDMVGREVELKKDLQRVVTSNWDSADILVSVMGEEAMNRLVAVGTTKSSNFIKSMYAEMYPQIGEMPEIGGGRGSAYDVEMITSLNPDVFIINTNSAENVKDTMDNLEKAGIPSVILSLSAEPMRTPQEGIRLIGELFDRKDRAKEVTDFIDQQFDLIESKKLFERENKPTIYMEKGSGNSEEYDVAFASTQGWGGIIEFVGGENIIKENNTTSVQVDPEYLLSEDPDYIVIAGGVGWDSGKRDPLDVLNTYSKRKGWDNLSAVKNGDFYALSHEQSRNQLCFFPSLYLAKIFYPEDFEDINPTEVLREFFDRFMLLDFERGTWSIQREVQ